MHQQNVKTRMSPWTALWTGLSLTAIVAIMSGAAITLYGMRVVNGNAGRILEFAEAAIDDLPELIESMPPVVQDALNSRRAPEYADHISATAQLVNDDDDRFSQFSIKIENNGDAFVSLLALHVVTLNDKDQVIGEWTHYAATPFAAEDGWPGPILPGKTRLTQMREWRCFDDDLDDDHVKVVVEISDVCVFDSNASEADVKESLKSTLTLLSEDD